VLDLVSENLSWRQELKQENKYIYYAKHIMYTLRQVLSHNNFTTKLPTNI